MSQRLSLPALPPFIVSLVCSLIPQSSQAAWSVCYKKNNKKQLSRTGMKDGSEVKKISGGETKGDPSEERGNHSVLALFCSFCFLSFQ